LDRYENIKNNYTLFSNAQTRKLVVMDMEKFKFYKFDETLSTKNIDISQGQGQVNKLFFIIL